MKLSGTVALYTQLKELENAVAVTKRQIALAEELAADVHPTTKKVKARKPRAPKALPYDGVIGKVNGAEPEPWKYGSGVKLDDAGQAG